MVGGGSKKTDTLEAGDIELDFDDGQFISNHNGTQNAASGDFPFLSFKTNTAVEVGDVRIL